MMPVIKIQLFVDTIQRTFYLYQKWVLLYLMCEVIYEQYLCKNRKNSINLIYFSLFVIVCMFSVFDFYMHIYGMRILMLLFYIILICIDERKIIEEQL